MSRLRRLRRRAAAERGFTLIELLIASSLSLVVMTATMMGYIAFVHRATESSQLNDAQDLAVNASSVLARQLRNLASPTSTAPQSVEKAGSYDLVFRTVDPVGPNSGANKSNVRRLRYCLGTTNTSTLYLQSQTWTTAIPPAVPDTTACPGTGWTSTRAVVQSVNNTYSGQDRPIFGFNATDMTAITRITQKLWIDPKPARAPKEISLTTAVDLRNQNRKPVASFLITQGAGTSVVLNGSDSTDPEGQPLGYAWSADGTNSTCHSVVCTITLTGNNPHTLVLTTTDSGGLTDTSTQTYTVPGYP